MRPPKLEENHTNFVTSEILEFHQIEECNRMRIIDWMLSVFRAFKISVHQTFFLAISILDRYLVAKYEQKVSLGNETLYIIGMTAIFLSSKYEDVIPIHMRPLLEKAGHGRFSQLDLLNCERDILLALNFRLH